MTPASSQKFGARLAAGFAQIGITGKGLVIGTPLLWMVLFFLVPFLIVFKISLATKILNIPPFSPLLEWSPDGFLPAVHATLDNYKFLLSDNLYIVAYLDSVKIALISTLLCLVIAFPIAYGVTRAPESWRNPLLLLIVLPFWTSLLLRVYSWIGLLKNNGLINDTLISLGIISDPLPLLNNAFAVYLGIVYSYLPFMLLPLYATLEKLDTTLLEAASDLGASRTRAFFSITLPLSVPGIIAGSMLVFIPTVGEFVIPSLLGGPNTVMIGRVLWNEFFENQDWPIASAVAIAIMILLVIPIIIFQRYQERAEVA
jgi:putrescine transport system permease protein